LKGIKYNRIIVIRIYYVVLIRCGIFVLLFYCFNVYLRVMKSRRMRWAGHVARVGRGELHTVFWWGNLRERDHSEVPGLDGRILLSWIFGKWVGGMDWIELAQDRDRWRAHVNAVLNLREP
jgi:hypothetical protein